MFTPFWFHEETSFFISSCTFSSSESSRTWIRSRSLGQSSWQTAEIDCAYTFIPHNMYASDQNQATEDCKISLSFSFIPRKFRKNLEWRWDYLFFIAHWNLNKDHWETWAILNVIGVCIHLGLQLLVLNPETAKTEKKPIERLNQEKDNAEFGKN